MSLRILLLLVSAMVVSASAEAQKLYKWVDKDGNVSYHDQPPEDSRYRVEEKTISAPAARPSSKNIAAAEKNPVVLYATPKCSQCELARKHLQKRGVPFSEKNVEGDRKLQDELIREGGELMVPTLKVGKKVMRGYLETLLDGELDDAGYAKSEEKLREATNTDPKPEASTAPQP